MPLDRGDAKKGGMHYKRGGSIISLATTLIILKIYFNIQDLLQVPLRFHVKIRKSMKLCVFKAIWEHF